MNSYLAGVKLKLLFSQLDAYLSLNVWSYNVYAVKYKIRVGMCQINMYGQLDTSLMPCTKKTGASQIYFNLTPHNTKFKIK